MSELIKVHLWSCPDLWLAGHSLNTELVGDDLARVLPNIAKLPNVVEGTKNAQDSILAMIDSMLGPELQDD